MRPRFHFTARTGWINDPHGITYRDGAYHTFFQFVPDADRWQPNCHWGHARGKDLFDLQELPVAIAPGEGDDGIWTGSLLLPDPADPLSARVYYTAVSTPEVAVGRVRVARPSDADWENWTKGEVLVEAPPSSLGVRAFRDPFLVRGDDRPTVLVGAALEGGTAAALAYEIGPEGRWRPMGIACSRPSAEREGTWMGSMWECPQLVRADSGRHLLLTSVWDDDTLYYAAYGLGTWDGDTFAAESWHRLSYGPSYYAPSTFVDRDGRDCVIFWMREVRAADRSWTGAHSIPFLIEPGPGGVVLRVHPDLDTYRVTAPGGVVDGSAARIEWTPEAGERLLLDIGTALTVTSEVDRLVVEHDSQTWSIPGSPAEIVLIVDGTVVEIVTANGILGFPVAPVRTVRVREGRDIRVWGLEKL